jgi:hypothetical protein
MRGHISFVAVAHSACIAHIHRLCVWLPLRSGDYGVELHGSAKGGLIDAVQLEMNSDLR